MTIKLAIAGYGYWGKKIAHAIKTIPDFSLSAIFDTNIDALRIAQQDFPMVLKFDSWDLFLQRANVDALWIAVPVASHSFLAIDALRAGIHVLVEKPLAQNSYQAEEILDAIHILGNCFFPAIYSYTTLLSNNYTKLSKNQT